MDLTISVEFECIMLWCLCFRISPGVFVFLCASVPPIMLLENAKLERRRTSGNNTCSLDELTTKFPGVSELRWRNTHHQTINIIANAIFIFLAYGDRPYTESFNNVMSTDRFSTILFSILLRARTKWFYCICFIRFSSTCLHKIRNSRIPGFMYMWPTIQYIKHSLQQNADWH